MARDDDVVVTLLAERGRALTGYAYLLCGDVHDAEDLVQDALVKVFGRRRRGLRLEAAEGYVRRTILTTYLDGWRRRRRWADRRHLVAVPDAQAGHESASTDRLDVVTALAALPRQQRACVVLRFYDDLTVPEIAAETGLAEGTVKRYLHLGTHRLEALLGPVAEPTPHVRVVREA